MQVLQFLFLQELQDLALKSCTYLASLALKMKLFLQGVKYLARKLYYIFLLQDSCKIIYILQEMLHF